MQTNEEIFLEKLSDEELLFDTREAIRAEREATSVVVKYFREIFARELYLKHACSSLFQFATTRLGYCDSSAQARINAMKLVITVPQVEKQIEDGELSLTAAANLQTFFQMEKKWKKVYTTAETLEVVACCLKKSTREVKQELASRNPQQKSVESCKPVSADRFELKFTISDSLEAQIRKLKGLLAHSNPDMKTEELLQTLVELGLEKLDPARKASRAKKRKNSLRAQEAARPEEESKPSANGSPAETQSRYIPADVRHEVWMKNAGRGCEFESATGDRCGSKHALQLDHVKGFATGGVHTVNNLRVLCAQHNRFIWKLKMSSCARVRTSNKVREKVCDYEGARLVRRFRRVV